jgi:CRP-like cAMP-binding protein/PAS domain-containing protein
MKQMMNADRRAGHITRLLRWDADNPLNWGGAPEASGHRPEELWAVVEELRGQNEELRATHAEAERQRRRYRELFELSPVAHFVTDGNGLIVEANRAARVLLAAREEFLIGRPFASFIAPEERHGLHEATMLARERKRGFLPALRLKPLADGGPQAPTFVAAYCQRDAQEIGLLWSLRRTGELGRSGGLGQGFAAGPDAAEVAGELAGAAGWERDTLAAQPAADPARLLKANGLLGTLAGPEAARLLPHLKPVKLGLGQVVQEAHAPLDCAYFPVNCVVSMVALMSDGRGAEASIVGREGMIGVRLLHGESRTPNRVVVQVPGVALRVPAPALRECTGEWPTLRAVLHRYVQARLVQTSQIAACNSLHMLEQRLARALLMIQDRALLTSLPLTHESLAALLGVRRSGVTVAARQLVDEGIIANGRGKIMILDRRRLEAQACECYRQSRDEQDRLLNS